MTDATAAAPLRRAGGTVRGFRPSELFRSDFARSFGPAWIVMMADMDAACVIEAAQTGAEFGYGLIWLFLLLIVPLFIVQELAGRISIATGRGLGSVIREHYSTGWSLVMTLPMAVTDVVTYAIEYIGIAIGLEIVGLNLWYTIPVVYVVHILVVTKRKYSQAELPLLVVSGALIACLAATLVLSGVPAWTSPVANPLLFQNSASFLVLVAASVGAVIMPFMIFFQASATGIKSAELREAGFAVTKPRALRSMRVETLVGAVVTELLMVITAMAFARVRAAQSLSVFATAHQLGQVLTPVAGAYAPYVFCVGLIAAAFIALIVISMASAWGIGESLGMDKRSIWIVYVAESVPGVLAALFVPAADLISIVIYLLVFFVFILIGPMIMLGVIGSDPEIMGDLAMGTTHRRVYWATFAAVISTACVAVAFAF